MARELRVWHELRHPNILPLEAFYLDEDSAMEAWIITLWQSNGNVMKYTASTGANEATRLKLVSHSSFSATILTDSRCRSSIPLEDLPIYTTFRLQSVTAISRV